MTMQRFSTRVFLVAGLTLALALPAFAGSSSITNGIDLWRTPGDGGTFVDFAREPLPAGFFCSGSPAFTGRVVFAGVPIKTLPADALGGADTVIQRLDDATFTKSLTALRPFALRGRDGRVTRLDASAFQGREAASTRIQVKAISFASVRPVQTGCGAANVSVSLAGEQPVTEMVILRDHEKGGRFYAPLSLQVKITFTPLRGGAPVEVVRPIQFPAKALSVWSEVPARQVVYDSFVRVDTDADGAVDVMLPGTSNFAAGFKDRPARGHGIQEKDASTYCWGFFAEPDIHCHGTDPVVID